MVIDFNTHGEEVESVETLKFFGVKAVDIDRHRPVTGPTPTETAA